MLRREARMRKEYLANKRGDIRRTFVAERKAQLREALEGKTMIPSHLRKYARDDKNRLELDDDARRDAKTHIDDEYAFAGAEDPKVLVTTSHAPSGKLTSFAKELRLLFPDAQRMNRGSAGVPEVIEQAKRSSFTDVVFVHEMRGEPNEIIVSHLPLGPTVHFGVHGTVMRHDLPDVGPMSQQKPHLVFENFSSQLGQRIKDVLRYLFPVPRPDTKRVMTFDNNEDYISFRQHTFVQRGKEVVLTEIGPRFELRPYLITLGTADMKDAEVEWQLSPYTNTAKKRRLL